MSNTVTTPPPVFTVNYAGHIAIQSGPNYGDPDILDSDNVGPDIAEANGDLVVLAYNHHQELVTRLYNLINDAKTVLLDLGTHVDTDDVNSNGLLLSLTQAEETLKKVIQ